MKRIILIILLLLSLCCLTNHLRCAKHADPFYNYDSMYIRIPLINPIEISRLDASSPWDIELQTFIWIADYPGSQGRHYPYGHVIDPEKFAVHNGVIMAYSTFVDTEADVYIQENYYHWFVMIPEKEITKGFQTEDEFLEYIQMLGVEEPDWQTPDEAHKQFMNTACLEWMPDCHFNPFYKSDAMSITPTPLGTPTKVNCLDTNSLWDIELHPGIRVPESQYNKYHYARIVAPEKFAVKKGVIMAYSSYVDEEAIAFIQNNYYYWFVMVPDKEITKGFHTEEEFLEYIQTLGIKDPDWQNPDEAVKQFWRTGCMGCLPDCEQDENQN